MNSKSFKVLLAGLVLVLLSSTLLYSQPAPPIDPQIFSRENDNRLTWQHNPQNPDGYVLQYEICRGTSSGNTTAITTVGYTTAFNDNTAIYDQEYFYTIRAIGADTLVSDHSEEVMRFLPRAGLTDIEMQIHTVEDQQYASWEPYPGQWTDTYFRIRTAPGGGSSYGSTYYSYRQIVEIETGTSIPPGGPYYVEVIVGRPDWHDNPAGYHWVSYSSSRPFWIDAEGPYEDNASSTYFNSSQYRVMAEPIAAGGVKAASFSNSGGGFWRQRTPFKVRPYTERLLNPTTYLSRLNSPCRITVNIPPRAHGNGTISS